ncbi:hypothetical protein EB118_14740 [bacterium]|nr:hypothetical protein [bacterium]NDC95233.1 hypothetical protein [bacterium]NDD84984.1 hypothetical protein [bacterium]NDG31314.1 hypothetical protein [bacterium]
MCSSLAFIIHKQNKYVQNYTFDAGDVVGDVVATGDTCDVVVAVGGLVGGLVGGVVDGVDLFINEKLIAKLFVVYNMYPPTTIIHSICNIELVRTSISISNIHTTSKFIFNNQINQLCQFTTCK